MPRYGIIDKLISEAFSYGLSYFHPSKFHFRLIRYALFHKYGADRSHVLNLGVKLNESTNFTILMPDLFAHGESPKTPNSAFGGCETEDAVSAVQFVRNLRTMDRSETYDQRVIDFFRASLGR